MVHRIEALSAAMPHFAPAIDLVARAALVSARTSMPLRVPPILLLGEPGIGKTYTLRRLAEAIGADFSLVGVNITDAFLLRGLNTAWRGAKMGRVAEILLGATTAPVILADEFDKAVGDQIHRPYDTWYSLLDPENSAAFKDDYLQMHLHADQIIWVASANDLSPIPTSILDRFLILEIPKPDYDQLRRIVTSVYSSSRQAYGGAVAEHLSEELVHELAKHNPRRLGMLIDLAVGFAAADGRRSLSVDDVRRAERLAGGKDNGFRRRVGFAPCRL
jgi:ATP-dependent Lon protease